MAAALSLAAAGGLFVAAIVPTARGGAWSGSLVVASIVLVASGVAKGADPHPTTAAVRGLGVAVPVPVVRALGLVEVLVGVAATLAGGRTLAVAVTVAYVGFAVVAVAMSRTEGIASCGCFGGAGARPGALHVVVNTTAAAGAVAAVATDAGGVGALIADTPLAGAPAIAGVALGAAAMVAVLTVAAETLSIATTSAGTTTDFHLVDDR